MNTQTKPGWAQSDDGIIDWENIFEDEATGLIPEILHANTPFIIKEFATVIIQQLFLCEDDSINLMKHVIALNQIIPDDREMESNREVILEMRAEVIELLRKIKDERIQKTQSQSHNKTISGQDRRDNS